MTKLELLEKEIELKNDYNTKLDSLRLEYANLNKEYNVGDYIRSLSGKGIIKIETIKYALNMNEVIIMYCGYQHIYLQGHLLQNEYKEITCLTHNLEKIDYE